MAKARTAKQKAALRKAQLASAKKRRLKTGNGYDYGPMKHWAPEDRKLYRQGAKKKKKTKKKRKGILKRLLGRG